MSGLGFFNTLVVMIQGRSSGEKRGEVRDNR